MISAIPKEDILNRKLENPYVTMWLEGEILCCKYASNLHVSLDVAKSVVEGRIFFSEGKSYPLLVDMSGIKSTTREAREYLATIGSTLAKAAALITGSSFNRMLGNVFLTIDKPAVPTRLFTNEEKAKEWLKEFL
jgi:hypothetical protein